MYESQGFQKYFISESFKSYEIIVQTNICLIKPDIFIINMQRMLPVKLVKNRFM